jgi:CBS domain-containing protein
MQESNEPRSTSVSPRGGDVTADDMIDSKAGGVTLGQADRPDTRSPGGDDFSSSAAPIGQGSNTPVGDEPAGFQSWDARQPEPASTGFEAGGGFGVGGSSVTQAAPWGVGVAATAGLGYAAYQWWQWRSARNSRKARVRRALAQASALALESDFARQLPKSVGRAAGNAKSPWVSLAVVPLALWLRSQGGDAKRAGKQILAESDVEKRTKQLARDTAKLVERRGTRWIDEADPTRDRGWGWTPWLLAVPVAGGAYVAGRRLANSDLSSSNGADGGFGRMSSAPSGPARVVRDVMTRDAEVVGPDTQLVDVAKKMRDLDVGSIPVCDGERLLGMITDRDITIRATAEGKDPKSTPVRQVMTPEVTWVFEDEQAGRAASLMRENQIRRLPVLDRNDKLVGILAIGDLALELGNDRLVGDTLEDISQPGR